MTEPVTDAENAEAPVTSETTEAENSTTQSTPRAGRPRPSDVSERDERVFEYLGSARDADGNLVAKTKAQISSDLGMEPKLVYLSLFRLSRDGRIHRGGPNGTSHAWTVGEKPAAQSTSAEAQGTEAPADQIAQ